MRMSKGKIKFYQVNDKNTYYKFRKNIYIKKRTLGEGSFGKVILVERVNPSEPNDSKCFALKISKRFRKCSKISSASKKDEDEKPKELNFIEIRELTIMKKIKHPNVINLEEFNLCREEREVWILMDYVPTDLGKFYAKNKDNKDVMNENFFKNIAFQIINGANYLHQNMIMHRDLKLENILYDSEHNVAKIGDFGLSRQFDYEVNNKYTNVGTPAYQPPELLLGLDHYSTSFDIWSVGCIFVAICTGKILFGEKNSLLVDTNSQIKDNNSLGVLKFIIKIFGTLNDKNLPGFNNYPNSGILKNLTETKGIGLINYIKAHQLFHFENDNFYDLIQKMICIDPIKRISAKECLEHPWLKDFNI